MKNFIILMALTFVLAIAGCAGTTQPYVDPCDIDPYTCPGGINGN